MTRSNAGPAKPLPRPAPIAPSPGWAAFAGLLAVASVAQVLVRTSTHGGAIGPDAVSYMSTAASLIGGHGLQDFRGVELFAWPPLFPVLVAGVGWPGLEPLLAGRLLNAAAFGLVVLASALWLGRNLGSRLLAAGVATLLAASYPLAHHASYLESEPTFILFTVLALAALGRCLRAGAGRRWLAAAVVFSMAAATTRYAGVALVLAGALVLLLQPALRLRARLGRALSYAAASLLPLAAWTARNVLLFGQWKRTGPNLGGHSLLDLPGQLFRAPVLAILPEGAPGWAAWVPWASAAALVSAGVWAWRARGADGLLAGMRPAWPFGAFGIVYLLFLLATVSRFTAEGMNQRFLLVAFVPLLLFGACVLDRLLRIDARGALAHVKHGGGALAAAGLVLGIVLGVRDNAQATAKALREGFYKRTYNVALWEQSETIRFLKANPAETPVYANRMGLLHAVLALKPGDHVRGKYLTLPRSRDALHAMDGGFHAVWFKFDGDGGYEYDHRAIAAMPDASLVAELADGVVVRVGGGDGPPPSRSGGRPAPPRRRGGRAGSRRGRGGGGATRQGTARQHSSAAPHGAGDRPEPPRSLPSAEKAAPVAGPKADRPDHPREPPSAGQDAAPVAGRKADQPERPREPPSAALLSRLPNRAAFWWLVFALGVAGTQLPSFDQETLHPDEPGRLVMAAHVLDGNLPGVGIFDIKPPLFSALLAGTFAAFGRTLAAARLFGDVAVLLLCGATFAVARRWTNPVPAGLAALLIVAATAGYTGQATLTDVPAMALLMASAGVLLARRGDWRACAAAGVLASAAVLTRLNLALPAGALGAWLAFRALRGPPPRRWAPSAAFATAGLALPAVFFVLYWRADALLELRLLLIDVPLSYGAQASVGETLAAQAALLWRTVQDRPLAAVAFAAAAAAGGCAVAASRRQAGRVRAIGSPAGAEAGNNRKREPPGAGNGRSPAGPEDELLLAGMVVATGAALATAGQASAHYAYMCIPIGAVYAARGLSWAAERAGRLPGRWQTRARTAAAPAALAVTAGVLSSALHERATRAPVRQPIRRVAEAVAADRRPGDGVWPIGVTIAPWHLGTALPLPLVFAYDLAKPAVMRPLTESGYLGPRPLEDAMATDPVYLIVRSNGGTRFRPPGFVGAYDAEQAASLARWVRDNYSLFYDDGDFSVYKAKTRP